MTVYMRSLDDYFMENWSLSAHWAAVTVCGEDAGDWKPWSIMGFQMAMMTEAVQAGIVFG